MKAIITFSIVFFFFTNSTKAQSSSIESEQVTVETTQISTIEGVIRDENGEPIINAIANCEGVEVTSDLFGNYAIEVPTSKAVKIEFTHPSFQSYSRRIRIRKKKITLFSPKLVNNLTIAF